ncbi:MAG: heme ABC exporter ATP-binding protein CcmA [Rhodospirillales bacterium]
MKLEVNDLACERGGHPVFAGVTFALDSGGLLVLRGPNGAGKSSLLRLLAGLGHPASGTITVDGRAADDDPAAFAARRVYVGHQDALKPAFTVAENLAFWARLQRGGEIADAEIDGALAALGLQALRDLPARFLSAGQRRRAALARAIAAGADLWLLDEPTNALDAPSLEAFEAALGRHLDGGGSAIVSTHVAVGGERGAVLTLGNAA